jgi:hypothetical protein
MPGHWVQIVLHRVHSLLGMFALNLEKSHLWSNPHRRCKEPGDVLTLEAERC